MKSNLDAKLTSALALILAVAIVPVSFAAFADSDDVNEIDEVMDNIKETLDEIQDNANEVDETENETDETEDEQKKADRERIKEEFRKLREQYKEERKQIRDQNRDERDAVRDQIKQLRDQYKDRIRPFINDLKPDVADRPIFDRKPDLGFDGENIQGWAVLGGKAYESSMNIKGEAVHMGKGVWKVYSKADIYVSKRHVELDLNGFARSGHIMFHGTGTLVGSDDQPDIRVVLRGHYAPIAESEDEFAIAFTNAQVHNANTGHRIPLALVGSVTVYNLGTEPVPIEPEVTDIVPTIDEVLS